MKEPLHSSSTASFSTSLHLFKVWTNPFLRGRTGPEARAGRWSSRQTSQALLALIFTVVVEQGSKGIWPQCISDKICLSCWTGQEAWESPRKAPDSFVRRGEGSNIPNPRAGDSPWSWEVLETKERFSHLFIPHLPAFNFISLGGSQHLSFKH